MQTEVAFWVILLARLAWPVTREFDTLKVCLLDAPILGLFWIRMPASMRWVDLLISSKPIWKLWSPMRAGASASLRDGTALLVRKCWRRWSCVLIFVHTYGEPSPLCAQIIVRFGDFRSFGIVMACWLDGICCWDSFLLHSSTTREFIMLAPMASPDSLASVCDRDVRCHHWNSTPEMLIRHQRWWTSLLHHQQWAIQWTCCPNCPGRRGWRPPILKKWPLICRQLMQSWFHKCIPDGRDIGHGAEMDPSWFGAIPVGVFGAISELPCWWLQFGNLYIYTDGRLWRRRAPPATNSQTAVWRLLAVGDWTLRYYPPAKKC